jgi:hypothetical protein
MTGTSVGITHLQERFLIAEKTYPASTGLRSGPNQTERVPLIIRMEILVRIGATIAPEHACTETLKMLQHRRSEENMLCFACRRCGENGSKWNCRDKRRKKEGTIPIADFTMPASQGEHTLIHLRPSKRVKTLQDKMG